MPGRPGRKRKMGERHPKGQLKRRLRTYYSPSLHPLRQFFEEKGLADKRMFSEVGRLAVTHALSPEQNFAAFIILEIYTAYDCATDFHRTTCSSGYKMSHDRAKESQASNPQARQNAKSEFQRLQEYMADLPKPTKTALEELCVENKFVAPAHLPAIREFLSDIAPAYTVVAENEPKKRRKRKAPTSVLSGDEPATGFVKQSAADRLRGISATENEAQRRDFASEISRDEMRRAGQKSSRRQ